YLEALAVGHPCPWAAPASDCLSPHFDFRAAITTPAVAAPETASAITPAVEVRKAPPFFFDESVVVTTTPVIADPAVTEIGALEPMISPAAFTISTVKLPAASPGSVNW